MPNPPAQAGYMTYDEISSTPEQMSDMLKLEIARWEPIVKASGARAD